MISCTIICPFVFGNSAVWPPVTLKKGAYVIEDVVAGESMNEPETNAVKPAETVLDVIGMPI